MKGYTIKVGGNSIKVSDAKTGKTIGTNAAKLQDLTTDVYFATYGKKDDPNWFSGMSKGAKRKAQNSPLSVLTEAQLMKVHDRAKEINYKTYAKQNKGK